MSLPFGLTARGAAWAVLDVALVAYVVYKTLALLRGTRAVQVAVGLGAVGAGLVAARRLGLDTLSWLLDHFLDYSVILIIVVFQADIRRGLARLGRRLFGKTGGTEERHAIDQVLRAAGDLAARRVGALIVLEREADVSEFVQGGTTIDAPVSLALLLALFAPTSPLHDGAAIVRNFRVQQAGAILPLSQSKLPAALGTRHRAALGLTEDTDAVVIVVSEERGTLGLASAGRVETDLEAARLRGEIERAFGRAARA